MFELDPDFQKDGELSFVASGPEYDDQTITMIGGELIGGWTQRNDEIYLRVDTYKHHKFYVDGAMIDLIQKLAHHNMARWDAGRDEDGDLYWEVSFKIAAFREKLGTFSLCKPPSGTSVWWCRECGMNYPTGVSCFHLD